MFSSSIAEPVVSQEGLIVFQLEQDYLESLVDRWADETFKEGTYSQAGHVHLYNLVEYAGRLDDVQRVVGLSPAKLAETQQRRYEVCTVAIATMRALRDGHSLAAIVGSSL